MGKKAAVAALPFGAAAGWLAYRSILAVDAQAWWMLFWMMGALQLWVLTQLAGNTDHATPSHPHNHTSGPPQSGGWVCAPPPAQSACARPQRPLAGLGPCLVGGCALCQLAALGGLCLRLQGLAAAAWQGGSAAALVWVALCLVALACAAGG